MTNLFSQTPPLNFFVGFICILFISIVTGYYFSETGAWVPSGCEALGLGLQAVSAMWIVLHHGTEATGQIYLMDMLGHREPEHFVSNKNKCTVYFPVCLCLF